MSFDMHKGVILKDSKKIKVGLKLKRVSEQKKLIVYLDQSPYKKEGLHLSDNGTSVICQTQTALLLHNQSFGKTLIVYGGLCLRPIAYKDHWFRERKKFASIPLLIHGSAIHVLASWSVGISSLH
ncbi:hypothetical protein BD560DRAFT_421335 [Blakeslea trispora]|nr:hypothetical protein BD560DRAFT_421335 [Blakeslea trispora]